jgi:hypothetical protein
MFSTFELWARLVRNVEYRVGFVGLAGWLIYLSTACCTSMPYFCSNGSGSEIVLPGLSRDDKRGGCAGISSAAIVHGCDSLGM